MLKRILLFMITLFALAMPGGVSVAEVAENYEYTLFQEIGGVRTPIQKPYSCNTLYDLISGDTSKTVNMTPVFERACRFGEQSNADDTGCEPIKYKCYEGEYLYVDEEHGLIECRSCPRGSYCDALAAGTEYDVTNWQYGIVECPAGITTGGQNSKDESECSWYMCKPGEQLKMTNNTWQATGKCYDKNNQLLANITTRLECKFNNQDNVWEIGKCYDESNNLLSNIKTESECVARCQACDADNYCVGGNYDLLHINASMKACPTKITAGAGTSEPGSFRCSYTCPVGLAMHVIGDWYRADTDCEPCPKGSYCPSETVYPETTVYDVDNPDANQPVSDGYIGAVACTGNKTTNGRGAKYEYECENGKTCRLGTYLDINNNTCEPCPDDGISYCPGGEFTSANADEYGRVGVYECPQYVVKDSLDEIIYNPNNPVSLENQLYQTSQPTADRTACSCPDGYSWTENGTCCRTGEFCCPRNYMVYTVSQNNRQCRLCQENWNNTSNPNAVYCTGTVIKLTCVPAEGEYFTGSACQACAEGSHPTANQNGCVCDDDKKYWSRQHNSCVEYTRNAYIYYTDLYLDGRYSTHGNPSRGEPYWSKQFTYSSAEFTLDEYTPTQSGYVFEGYCKDVETCEDPVKDITVVPHDQVNQNGQLVDVKYYAQMKQQEYQCGPGYYLNTSILDDTSKPNKCAECEAGFYCPGGTEDSPLSVTNIGKHPCVVGTYNPTERQSDSSACKPCTEFDAHLTTQGEGTGSADGCGYWCEVGKYAADGTFVCDQVCTEGDYCPGGGPTGNLYDDWRRYFYSKNEPGSGRFPCPEGLTSDAGARQCYKQNCAEEEFVKKNANGVYECVKCDLDNHKCPGGKITVDIQTDERYHVDFGGRSPCVTGYRSVAPAARCYKEAEKGQFINEFGVPGACLQNWVCPGDATGMRSCPLGSVSEPGAGDITDCKCLSDVELTDNALPQYRPDGVYTEKGAGLLKIGNEYFCVNTYLAVDNETSYENPGLQGEIPGAGARVVACKWNGTQTVGKYNNCTDKAMRICDKDVWTDAIAPKNIKTQDVMNILADAFNVSPVSEDLFSSEVSSSILQISSVGEDCPEEVSCPTKYWHHGTGDEVNKCYALVDFVPNDGTPSPESYLAYDDGNENQTYNLPELPEIARSGYDFGGWYDNDEFDGDYVTTSTDLSGDKTLYAKWTPIEYTITYELDGGTNDVNNPSTYTIESATITLVDPTKLGYTFAGWYGNDQFGGGAITEIATGSTGDITLYAKWTPITYTVKFDGNGADDDSDTMADVQFEYGEEMPLPDNVFRRTNYDFVGWCQGSPVCDTAQILADGADMSYLEFVNDTVTLYAQWVANGCNANFPEKDMTGDCYATITYKNVEGATLPNGVSNPTPYYANTPLPLVLPDPSKSNYTFLGWYDNDEFEGEAITRLPTGSTGHKTFWAKWEPVCTSGKYLHIGDTAICLYEEKPTSPALAIKIDRTVYYGHMCKDCSKTMNGDTGAKLHIRYNNETYNVYDLTAQ